MDLPALGVLDRYKKSEQMPILDAETSIHPPHLLYELQEESDERRWFVFYTKARQEKAFARQLVGYDVPFFLPLVAKENLIRGKKVKSQIPVFGGYIFLYVNEDERVKALTTNRISSTLEVHDQAQLVYDLRNVQQLIQADAPLTVESRLATGDHVRIKAGPMEGLEGVVERRRGQAVLYVAVTMLQQSATMEIDDYLLEPI